jgi:nucleoside 2-deoxyribosyltransferase
MSSPTFDIQAGNPQDKWMGRLTFAGWERYGELTRTRDKSNFAFLARKFANPDLDKVYAECLKPAVQKTGYDLRVVTQRAGLIDAIIESEIRNCKFLVADLSDGNAGSYWEAGFAEGLGKPVFYICKELDERGTKIQTHFDTAHRMTIRWRPDPASFQQTENELKAVIRNTLLGEVSQVDVM